jgi:hypothetical protein
MNAVSIELWARLHETTRDWSTWAEREVTSWPSARGGRRMIAAGSPMRGNELFAMIAERTTPP